MTSPNLSQLDRAEQNKLIARKLSKEGLPEFCITVDKKYTPEWFHYEIAWKLEEVVKRVEQGESPRLMIFMPPRHGKSALATQKFPAWVLGNHPDWPFIVSSYSADLATKFGQDTRDIMLEPKYQDIFETRLRQDTKSKSQWMTGNGGGYTSVGVGGTLTGKGFKIGIVDDPIKNREEADSETMRESVWRWYTSTFLTREEGSGAIIVILCMTGDTPVLMADGAYRQLRNIKAGDLVATYENGKLSTAPVLNVRNNGGDKVHKITTTSGKVVRANERHPFLAYKNNSLTWARLKDLHTAQKIVIAKDNGVNGRVKPALNVQDQQYAEVCAAPTTISENGPMATDHHLSTKDQDEKLGSNETTASLFQTTIGYLKNKVASVLFANSHLQIMSEHIGVENSVLTTAMRLEKSGRFSAMTAILLLVTQKLKLLPWLLRSTSDFTLDSIASIDYDGVEDVYDVQIERTENFIANGVVSHNTRWHDDDLAGRLLAKAKEDPEADQWEILEYPAIAEEDEEHRKTGDALWPAKFNKQKLLKRKASMGSYEFSALYQQNPIDEENQTFKEEWFQYKSMAEVMERKIRKFASIDPQFLRPERNKKSDHTGVIRNYVDDLKRWNIKATRYKLNSKKLIDLIFKLHSEGMEAIGIEESAYTEAIGPFLEDEMRKRGEFPLIVPLKHKGTMKETRIKGLVPWYETRMIYHVTNACDDLENELLRFPKAKNDDLSDALAYMPQVITPSSNGFSDANFSDESKSPKDKTTASSLYNEDF